MAWSVDRLGRSLQDLVGFLSELHASRKIAARFGVDPGTVQRISRPFEGANANA
jgi:hypothetical protein